MSLIAWYKLEDLLDSSGNANHLSYVGTSGQIVGEQQGKLGACYGRPVLNNGPSWLRSSQHINLSGSSFTMCCWAFVSECTTSANGLVTNHNHGTNTGAGITVKQISSSDFRISCNTGTGSSRTYNTYYGTSNIKDRWAHLVVRYDISTDNLSLWVDGNKEYELTYKMACSADYIGVFKWSTGYSGSSYDPKTLIDDVRIYDHALSPKEIKELAKAKILHYKFDDFQEPTINEYAYPNFNTSESSGGWSHWGSAGHQGTYGQNTDPQYIYGNQSYSHWVANGSSATGNYLVYQSPAFEGGYRSAQVIVCSEDKSEITNSKVYPAWNARSGGAPNNAWTSIEQIPGTHFYHCKCEGIMQDGSNDLVGFYVTKGQKIYFSMAQLEQKPYCTPYTPNIRTGTVHDSSGYDNHAELALATTPRWVGSDQSKIGGGAYSFNGSQVFQLEDTLPSPPDQVTVSAWVKTDDASVYQHVFSKGTKVISCAIYQSKMYCKFTIGGVNRNPRGNTVLQSNRWYHLVWLYDGKNIKFYIDGELDFTSPDYTGALEASDDPTLIGAEMSGATGSEPMNCMLGLIDDIRVYATALSDEDIKELYQTRASIDSQGNLYVQGGFIEYPVNGCPPFSSWTLSGGAYLSGDVLILPQRGSSAISPFVDIDGKSWTWSVDFYSNSPKDGSVTDGGYLQGSNYYDSNKNPTPNTAGYSSNGNAGTYPINQWTRKVWSYVAGNSVKYLRINISNNASYTPVSFMAKNPAITINGTSSFVPYNSQSLLTTTPSISHTQEGNISSNVLSELGPTNGLIAYYPLNGNANDYSGNNNHGTNNGATITSGIRGSAYSFDGSADQFIDISGHGLHLSEMYNGGATFSCWVYPLSHSTVIAQNIAGFLYFTINSSGKLQNMIRNVADNVNYWVYGKETIPLNKWSHVVCVVENGVGGRYYLNGELDGVGNNVGVEVVDRATSSRLGFYNASSLDGKMCDARIYNRALSPEEIKILYDVTKPNAIPMQLSNDGTVYLSGELKEA